MDRPHENGWKLMRMLTGVTVLELGQVIAGTYAGTLLADMGAEVIKIEPLRGDAARNPAIVPIRGQSAVHLFANRNKKSVALDLKSEEGRQLFLTLVRKADAVIDNFRPGTMERLKIDHKRLLQYNSEIVTVSISGFGSTGPTRHQPAFDLVIQARAGHLSITGDRDGPPARMGAPMADLAGSMFACVALIGGLCHRELHHAPSHSDIGMLDSLVSLLGYDALSYLNTGNAIERHGTAHAHLVPWQAFAVSDGYIVIGVRDDKFWRGLCDAIDRPDLKADIRTRDNQARLDNREYVVSCVAAAVADRKRDELLAALQAYEVPAAPVNTVADVFADQQVQARGLVQVYDHPHAGRIRYVSSPLLEERDERGGGHAPLLGEHTADVLGGRLGIDQGMLEVLAARGIIRVIGPDAPTTPK